MPRKSNYQLKQRLFESIAVPVLVSILVSISVPMIISYFSPEKEIRNIINSEADLAAAGKINEVVQLYDDNAYVRDAGSGSIWEGKERITDRYKKLPKFNYLKHDAIEITLSSDGNYARAIADTIGEYYLNGSNVEIASNQGERWAFKKIDRRWLITGFNYNIR